MTNLTDRLERGKRWPGDNAEVLRAMGIEHLVSEIIPPTPLDLVDDTLRQIPEPWRSFTAFNDPDGNWSWSLYLDDHKPTTITGTGPTAAIALTVAILKASQP